MTRDEVQKRLTDGSIHTVRVVFDDNSNVGRARNIPARQFLESVMDEGVQYPSAMMSVDTGANFVLAAGAGFAGGYPSWLLKPDLDTFVELPWAQGSARVVADVTDLDGRPIPVAPRNVLKKVISLLEAEGYAARATQELEFYVFKRFGPGVAETSWQGMNCYAEVIQGGLDDILTGISTAMETVGVAIEAINTEYGPGQFEASMRHVPALTSADYAFLFKNGVKEILGQMGYQATFMTKPMTGRSGSGAHIHHSLYRTSDGRNAFFDASAQDGLSACARHFLAGELTHTAALSALANPTVNSYRRLRPYTFAPSNVSWGYENRMCLVRVPAARGEATHLENRLPGADNNPYHLTAAVLAAGLDGIRRKLEVQDPVVDADAYALPLPTLPKDLESALTALRRDEALTDILGQDFVESYAALKESEIGRYKDHVSDWEIREYAELF